MAICHRSCCRKRSCSVRERRTSATGSSGPLAGTERLHAADEVFAVEAAVKDARLLHRARERRRPRLVQRGRHDPTVRDDGDVAVGHGLDALGELPVEAEADDQRAERRRRFDRNRRRCGARRRVRRETPCRPCWRGSRPRSPRSSRRRASAGRRWRARDRSDRARRRGRRRCCVDTPPRSAPRWPRWRADPPSRSARSSASWRRFRRDRRFELRQVRDERAVADEVGELRAAVVVDERRRPRRGRPRRSISACCETDRFTR